MNSVELISVIAMGLPVIAGVSAAIYVYLPPSMWQSAGRHGRYAGLGARPVPEDKPSGRAPARGFRLGLHPQG